MNKNCRGPAWSNSLFEDNAEFDLGMRLAIDKQKQYAGELLQLLQRKRLKTLLEKLSSIDNTLADELKSVAANLSRKSVWIIGGDGWAYNIGFGGLDHVMASGHYEADSFHPFPADYNGELDNYLDHLQMLKSSINIPIIANRFSRTAVKPQNKAGIKNDIYH